MKKKVFLLIFIFLSGLLSAEEKEVRVVVLPPKLQNLKDSEAYIGSIVHDKLEANLRIYTKFKVVDLTNESEIKKLQAKSEGDSFDEDTTIELQRLVSANNAVFSTIIRTRMGFIISASFTDLARGEKKAVIPPISREYSDELFDGANCAVDEITIGLCEQLNQRLSSSQLSKLRGAGAASQRVQEVERESEEVQAKSKKPSVKSGFPREEYEASSYGYKMFQFDKDAEDNIIFTNKGTRDYEVDIFATHRRKGFKHFGSITVTRAKAYKHNPLDRDLDQYAAIYFKVMNSDDVNILNMGCRHGDQFFEIQNE